MDWCTRSYRYCYNTSGKTIMKIRTDILSGFLQYEYSDEEVVKWFNRLLHSWHGDNRYIDSMQSGVWVCETHPLMPGKNSEEKLACDCGGDDHLPINLPTWVNGFCCSLDGYVIYE